MARYRPNVAALVQDETGQILICERGDFPGCWQVPQGGRLDEETPEQTLHRELLEEISLRPEEYRILTSRGPYRYRFPHGRRKRGFDGQEQTYFLVRLEAPRERVDVATPTPEFRDARWIDPARLDPALLPPMKLAVYRQVWRDFFGIDLPRER